MGDFIRLENVYKAFGETMILKNVCLSFERNKAYGFIGEGGSGKTTLLEVLSGYSPYLNGSIYIENKILGKDIDFIMDSGILLQPFGFLPQFNGLKNLDIIASIKRKVKAEGIKKVMKEVGLDPDSQIKAGEYSRSMYQKLGIAQALMEDPAILILDEPLECLDKSDQNRIVDILKTKKITGVSIFITGKSMGHLKQICDEIFLIQQGDLNRVYSV